MSATAELIEDRADERDQVPEDGIQEQLFDAAPYETGAAP